ncbi:MAG: DedA family protein, partial [Campylobacterota bacterium]|nr:DedA family protein [Campylobacterota bacterium]
MLLLYMDYLYLFVISLLAATILPMGSEAYFIYNLTIDNNIILLLLFATLGNSIGSLINYFMGKKGEEYLEKKNKLNKNLLLKISSYFDKYGGYVLFFSWLPIVGDPITIVAGI